MQLRTFPEAVSFLNSRVPRKANFPVQGVAGWRRAKEFMQQLGNPQNTLRVIHIAGTSGKGSTAYLISKILCAQGLKVGLHLSPHLLDIRERIQYCNIPITKKEFVRTLQRALPAIARMQKSKWGMPTYFEILAGMAFLFFQQRRVDYAVVETGLGGRYDGTNVITRRDKLAVLTSIGLDHTKILGTSLTAIAAEKAAIIPSRGTAITIQQRSHVNALLSRIAAEKKARLLVVRRRSTWRLQEVSLRGTRFSFQDGGQNISCTTSLLGAHQAENSALALKAIFFLSKRDGFSLSIPRIRVALAHAHFPGRLELRWRGTTPILLDVAHNPQKMRALAASLKLLFPGRTFTVLLAVKANKHYSAMLDALTPIARQFFLTSFSSSQDLAHSSVPLQKLAAALAKRGQMRKRVLPSPRLALRAALASAGTSPILITGSIYFIGELYRDILAASSKHPPKHLQYKSNE